MERNSEVYRTYVEILKHELVCAMGCTEPIAIAYCASVARAALGCMPDKVEISASGNIIKNAKSVVVPNTGGQRGIEAAAGIGIVAGNEKLELQVISQADEGDAIRLKEFLNSVPIKVNMSNSSFILDVEISVFNGEHSASARIVNEHTNIACVKKNGKIIYGSEPKNQKPTEQNELNYELLNVEDIFEFALSCNVDDVKETLDRQIAMNMAISEKGIKENYGACVGKTYLNTCGNDIRTRAKAYAASGSDARMNGCEMPVVINSGSGNQGITASVPVIQYAKELKKDKETLYRALIISNLVTLHEKSGIGRLSAYCGAISAGAGAGAGIAFLKGASCEEISETVVNALAVTSGTVCDGAKSSCAAKIAIAVEAGIMGCEMAMRGHHFMSGEGLVKDNVEDSIDNFARLARIGMQSTDKEIIKMMIE